MIVAAGHADQRRPHRVVEHRREEAALHGAVRVQEAPVRDGRRSRSSRPRDSRHTSSQPSSSAAGGAGLSAKKLSAIMPAHPLERPLALLDLVGLEIVAGLDVGMAFEGDAAFEAGADLGDVVLEPAQDAIVPL